MKPCLIQKHLPYRAQNFGETLLKTSWLLGSDLRRSIRSLRPDLIDTLQRSKLYVFLDQSSVQRIFLGFGTNRTPLFPPVVRLNILGSVPLSRTLYIAVFSVRVTPVPALAPPIST